MRRTALRFTAVDLPTIDRFENFLPAALPALQHRCGCAFLPVIATGGGPTMKISAADVLKPDTLRHLCESTADTLAFGPACAQPRTIPMPSWKPHSASRNPDRAVIGLIDTGIAFWNPRFVVNGTPQFAGMAYLDLDGEPEPLTRTEIAELCAKARGSDGDQRVRDILADRFPQSIHGKQCGTPGLLQPDEMSHGTAMADLAGRFDPAKPDAAPTLYGLELPQEVLLDSSGGSLEVVLIPAIKALVAMIEAAPSMTDRTDIVICLPFGFPGGPQDGSRASVRALRALMEDSAFAHVHLVLPMGNHLQHRCHARLPDLEPQTDSESLTWFLEPFDRSANTLDLFYRGAPPLLTLTAPDGRTAAHPFAYAPLATLSDGDAVVGAAWNRAAETADGWSRIRLTLGPTAAAEPKADVAQSGGWSIRLRAPGSPVKDLNAWILRDDWPGRGARAQNHLQSRFVDPAYVAAGPFGIAPPDDSAGKSLIRRAGTASVLTTAKAERIVCVGATARIHAGGPLQPAAYSGQPYDGAPTDYELVDDPAPSAGTPALGNGGPGLFAVSGTSVAAALRAGSIAARINGT
jgi:hypothetical protein